MSLCRDVLFWIPTRAWRDTRMYRLLRACILPEPNARLMLSIDPTVDELTEQALRDDGFSLVYVGDNDNPNQLLFTGENRTKRYARCRKTWDRAIGHCARCIDGCFSSGKIDVHLRQHD